MPREKPKLKMNVEKCKVVSAFSIQFFEFLDFSLEKEWSQHPSTRNVSEESQGQIESADFPQSGQKYPEGDGERESLHPGMAGHTELLCTQMGVYQSLLERSRESGVNTLNNKRTTHTGRILQYPCRIRVAARMRLKRCIRNCTHGGVRGGLAPPTRLY